MATPKPRSALYVSVGSELTHYDLDVASAALEWRSALVLPLNVQYVWPHPSRRFLYAACSNGAPDVSGDAHSAVALRIDDSGVPHLHGSPVALPSRPIHITADARGEHVLIAYNDPSGLTVHRIEADGSIGNEVNQPVKPDTGIYAHQVRVTGSNRSVIVVARGNDAKPQRAEDPGALKVFGYDEGRLTARASIAPSGGYGFGPRHLDLHPGQPWLYVSLERQNTLQMYRFAGDSVEPEPAYIKETLADTTNVQRRQRSGTIHVHPNGRYVYVANRASGTADAGGKAVFIGGENNIAVYAIDPQSGEPTAIQHADTHGIVPRTFALDRTGRILVAANSIPILTHEGDSVKTVSPNLAVFRVGDDGKLEYVRKYDIDVGAQTMFWMGIVS